MLERYEGAPVDELRLATRRSLVNLVDCALAERVDFVCIAGDLYDGDWKDYNTGFYFIREINRLYEAGIPVVMIAGNHDAASKMTKSLRLPAGVHFLRSDKPQTITFDDFGVAIHGQSFARQAVVEDLSRSYPDPIRGLFNIGLLHTCAEGREGHAAYAPCTIDGLRAKGYDYWALGHIHKREILHAEPLIVFPGNTQGRHIRETGAKGCMLVSIEENGSATTRFEPLSVARWETQTVRVGINDQEEDLFDRVRESMTSLHQDVEGMTTVVRLFVEGQSSLIEGEADRWLNEIRSLATQISGGSFWIEGLRWRLRLPEQSTTLDDGAPINLLLRELDDIRQNPERFKEVSSSLSDFLRRLPPEFRSTETSDEEMGDAWLREALEDVGPLLFDRLLDRREDDR